ncbi:MAG: transcription antitermination factor NusB [candidate division KSB1 bacterium]|nr:transcription antitermination factor NusB [candidate division KSB1 bacterium]MDZ7334149.1 transcription antitermination factor NusB [candidate division KSB1 bacterium]MDZ7357397.1 transcription antitermination factor NusB [candidate division KSB1 bacterium]MDZ7375582.1 transcription antitermination factor NusB [candidate division KSB1 bacterium]MDZ7401355.1 transcription antitermination factor NusB [candidate division KSB1 bacterium]
MSSRRRARELAVQALYALELSQNPVDEVKQDVIEQQNDAVAVKAFAEQLFTATVEHCSELDEIIKHKAVNWDFERIAILDKLILRLAICEFLYFEDIPPKVSIDEAIEIAKKFSTAKSGQFVNGILDAVLLELRSTNRLHKTGRGLIETTSQ